LRENPPPSTTTTSRKETKVKNFKKTFSNKKIIYYQNLKVIKFEDE
jgi:hypothetical protein